MAIFSGRKNPSFRNPDGDFPLSPGLFVPWVMCLGVLLATTVGRAESVTTAAPPVAWSDQPADTLEVVAGLLPDPVVPSAAGVCTRLELGSGRVGRDLGETLNQVAGVQVRRYGGAGFASVPALRGAAAAQIQIFMDGMPLNSAQTGATDLSLVPVDRLVAAEVHRGAVPTGWGGAGGAGAVNLVTEGRASGLSGVLRTGTWGDRTGRADWGWNSPDGSTSLILLAHGRRSDNDYTFTNHRQTFHTAGDDTVGRRDNAWFRHWGWWGSARHQARDWQIRLQAGFTRQDGGRPGSLNYPSPAASVRRQRADSQLRLDWVNHVRFQVSAAREKQFLYDPESEVDDGFGGTISSIAEDLTSRLSYRDTLGGGSGGLGRLSTGPLDMVEVAAGVQHRGQWFDQRYDADADPLRNRNATSAFAGLTAHLAHNRLKIMPAWRWQRTEDDFPALPPLPWLPEEVGAYHRRDDVSPSLGALWEIRPNSFFLQAHLAESVRVPTWIELFGHRGGIDGNRELAPEEIAAADLAVMWRAGAGYGRLALFRARTRNAIVFVQNSPGTSKARNIGRTRTWGLEWETGWQAGRHLQVSANLTWQDAEDQGIETAYQGLDLPFLSEISAWCRLGRRSGAVRPWAEVQYEGPRFRDRSNTLLDRAPERSLVNAGLVCDVPDGWLPGPAVSLSAEVRNLTDSSVYDIEQFPLPGRSWHLSLRWASSEE